MSAIAIYMMTILSAAYALYALQMARSANGAAQFVVSPAFKNGSGTRG